MPKPNKSEQSRKFEALVGRFSEVADSLAAGTAFQDLSGPINAVTQDLSDLRSLVETPTRKINSQPLIENDYLALQAFKRINDLEHIQSGFRANSAGRAVSLRHEYDSVTDVSPLAALTALRELNLASNDIKDLSALSILPLLETVRLEYNESFNAASLIGFPNIKLLSLTRTNTNDLHWIASLPKLTEIELGRNSIVDIGCLAEAPGLSSIHIGRNPITTLEPLRNHPNLSLLVIGDTLVEDVSPLFEVPKLSKIVLNRDMSNHGKLPQQLLLLEQKGVLIELSSS